MKLNYDPETDIVLCQVSNKRIDHAEEQGPIIVHFDRQDHPVLLEIQGGSRFIGKLARLALQSKKRKSKSVES
jgi:hypothetical protein